MDGDTLVVGAPHAAVSNAQQAGRVFVYLRTGTVWTLEDELVPYFDREAFDEFGAAVAVSGDRVVVGARRHNDDRGAAYVFERGGWPVRWGEVGRLTAYDGAAGDGFGAAVAIVGDTVVIGAGGADAGYVFKRAVDNWGGVVWWGPYPRLAASDGAAGDGFGCAVAVSGDSALIGAPGKTSNAGAAYVFKSAGGDWNSPQQTKLTASGVANAYLGYAVDLSGRYALLGAPGETSNAGAGYVFYSNGTTWSQQARLAVTGGAASDRAGLTVNLGGESADVALLGAPGAVSARGAAHLFTRQGTAWTTSVSNPLTATGGASDDALGRSVALFGDAAVAVAPGKGNAYIYRFDCGFGRYWPVGVWLFPGLPCDPDVATVSGQFGDDLGDANYGSSKRWYMYDWDENTKSLAMLTVASPITQGVGYELKTLDGRRIDFTGIATGSGDTPLVACHHAAGCFEISLTLTSGSETSRGALIGHPFPYPVDWPMSALWITARHTRPRMPTPPILPTRTSNATTAPLMKVMTTSRPA